MSSEAIAAVGTPTPGEGESTRARLRRRRGWLLGAGGGLLLTAGLVVAMMAGAAYQPVTYGVVVPDVQGPVNVRIVNNFAGLRGQIYIAPQPATHGALDVSVTNTGPYAVTIESVSMPLYPNAINQPAGPATFVPLAGDMPRQATSSSPDIAGATLRPGENIDIRLPFLTPICWVGGRSLVSTFWVTTKFLWWTHTFEVSWTPPDDVYSGAIMSQLPDPNGGPGALCPRPQRAP